MCERFHWTPNELYEQPFDIISKFLHIMFIEGQIDKINNPAPQEG